MNRIKRFATKLYNVTSTVAAMLQKKLRGMSISVSDCGIILINTHIRPFMMSTPTNPMQRYINGSATDPAIRRCWNIHVMEKKYVIANPVRNATVVAT